jgi:phosphopantothenoylcysteine decarboxylase/phosphopantothenate--cysteine ligase
MNLSGKKILLGVSGSIAAYKAVILLRALQKKGAIVRVIMTPRAGDFVSALTFEALTHHPVFTDTSKNQSWNNHIELSLWADLYLIAPATANTLAKMAQGMADDMLTACYLSARCPVMVSPAMDVDMWHHPATQANISTLVKRSVFILPVGYGELASGLIGEGRMSEPEDIVRYLEKHDSADLHLLVDKKVMVTAGPTHEAIDPVRYISNASTGKMGIALADTLAKAGAAVELILGPTHLRPSHPAVKVIAVKSAAEMSEVAHRLHLHSQICLFAAAVADYRPAHPEPDKIKKSGDHLELILVKNPDIAFELGQLKRPDQIHVGFALESTEGVEFAKEKRVKKNFDLIVLNSLQDEGAGFGGDTNKTTFFYGNNKSRKFGLKSKQEVAQDIVLVIHELLELKNMNQ